MEDFQSRLGTWRLLSPRKPSWLLSPMSLPGSRKRVKGLQRKELDMATAMEGGVRQERMPSWSFTGRLSVPYGNKRGPAGPARQVTGGSADVWIPHHRETVDCRRNRSKGDPGSDEGGQRAGVTASCATASGNWTRSINKRGPTDPATVKDKSPEIADRSCIR